MSFRNEFGPDGSVNITVIPSIGHLVQVDEGTKQHTLQEINAWRSKRGVLNHPPPGFDPSRYASITITEAIEEPVSSDHIHSYVEQSRLNRKQFS